MMLLLFSSLMLSAIHEIVAEQCDSSVFMKVRLQGGGGLAGRVELCWNNNSTNDYRWYSVCSRSWGLDETVAACQHLEFTNTSNMAMLNCKGKCFGKGSDEQVELNCMDNGCQIHSANVNICKSNKNAYILCDTSTLERKPKAGEDNSIIAVSTVLAMVIVALVIAVVLLFIAFPRFYQRKIRTAQQMSRLHKNNLTESNITLIYSVPFHARGFPGEHPDYQHIVHTKCALVPGGTREKTPSEEIMLQNEYNRRNDYATINDNFPTLENDEKSALDMEVIRQHYEICELDVGGSEDVSGDQRLDETKTASAEGAIIEEVVTANQPVSEC